MVATKLRKILSAALATGVIGTSVAVCASFVSLESYFTQMLERRFAAAPVQDWTSVHGLIVAGGSTHRTAEAIRLAQQHPHLKVVLSGPSDAEIAEAARLSPKQVLVDRRPQNTFENAVFSKFLVGGDGPGARWLLVTSATHMPRAIGSFLAAGFPIAPWPVADGEAAVTSSVATHEWLGLLSYWLRGQSVALFPGEADIRKFESRLTRKG